MTHVRLQRAFEHRIRRLLCWGLCLCMTMPAGPAGAIPASSNGTAQLLAALTEQQERLATGFDRDALLDATDYDAEMIVQFVQKQIAFQPYAGVLRGVAGTLAGRSGNAHDQAITLAAMLNDAGYEAVIARATLTTSQASNLVDQLAMPTFAIDGSAFDAVPGFAALEKQQAAALVPISELRAETDAAAARLTAELQRAKIPVDAAGMRDISVEHSRSYRWVRYRAAVGDEWIDVHPAFEGAAEWQLTPAQTEAGSVAEADLQQLTLEVQIEDSNGVQHSATGLWKAPVANLFDRPISIEVLSDQMMNPDGLQDLDKLANEGQFFFVRIDSVLPEQGLVFDRFGDVYPVDALSGLGTVFSTINKIGRQAASALDAMGRAPEDAAKTKQLARVWLDLHLDRPGAERRTIRRTLFERDAADPNQDPLHSLLQRWDISVANTIASPAWHAHKQSTQFAAAVAGHERYQQAVSKLQVEKENPAMADMLELYARHIARPEFARLAYLRSLFDGFDGGSEAALFPTEANVLAIRTGLTQSEGVWRNYSIVDILTNRQQAFVRRDSQWHAAPDVNLQRGVWETRAESFRLLGTAQPAVRYSAYELLAEQADWSAQSNAAAGTARLAPKQPGAVPSWWQVDLATGSVIGMAQTRAGAAGAEVEEYLMVKVIPLAITGAFFAVGSTLCISGGGGVVCCLAANASIAAAGYALSWLAGAIALKSLGVALFAPTLAPNATAAIVSVLADVGMTQITVDCS